VVRHGPSEKERRERNKRKDELSQIIFVYPEVKKNQAELVGVTHHPGMCGAVENHFPRIYQSGNTHQVSGPRQFLCHVRRAN
jgi:hypothetical protein